MKGAGLLALGEFGKGLAGGMTEAIKYEILKRRDDALFQREKTLEEYRHGKRTAEEEKTHQRRREEEETTYQRRLKEKESEPTKLEKNYKFIKSELGEDYADAYLMAKEKTGDPELKPKQKADAELKCIEMRDEGYSLKDINTYRKLCDLKPWSEKGTGEFKTKGGFLGLGGKEEEIKEFGPLEEETTEATTEFDRIKSLINTGEGTSQRADGTKKGKGYFGELKRPDGRVSTELSIGVNIDGKEMEIPLLVPTLTENEKQHLLSDKKPTEEIIRKAIEHAKKRMAEGKSLFAEEERGLLGGVSPGEVTTQDRQTRQPKIYWRRPQGSK